MKRKIKRIGFDLDGVVVDKPPVIPKSLLELIYRGKSKKKELSYRYPTHKAEIFVRRLSHLPFLRPPIKEQVDLLRKIHKSKKYEMYAVTSRYSFLKKRTKQWFDYYKLNGIFERIYINEEDEQPHLYKEMAIKKLKLDLFIDDDPLVLDYLENKIHDVKFIFIEDASVELDQIL